MATKSFVPPVAFHPGETLSEKLREMGMSIKEFAVRTSKPEKTIFAVMNGNSSITSDMAVAFETVTRIPAHFWLNMQRSYDEFQARVRREAIIEEAKSWAKCFPYAQMVELGWVPPCKNLNERVNALFAFFQISTVKAWQDYYCNQQLKVAFRISLSNVKDPYAISAWLRQGEIQAQEMSVNPFSEKSLRQLISSAVSLMTENLDDYKIRLQALCKEAGVKLLYTSSLPHAQIRGCARWMNNTPCIQLSDSADEDETFWFTFFHEVAHILLHGKKDVFLETVDCPDLDLLKESEADAFAARILNTE